VTLFLLANCAAEIASARCLQTCCCASSPQLKESDEFQKTKDKKTMSGALATSTPAVSVRKLFERESNFFVLGTKHRLLNEQGALQQLQLSSVIAEGSMGFSQTAKM
jgi:hypothetical protein